MPIPAKPPQHWFFRLLRAVVLLGVGLAFLALLGMGLLSWGFYNAGQNHLRELEAERRQQGLPRVTDAPQRPAGALPAR